MNISISKFKLVWKLIFGGREAVLDYVIDVANNLVAKIGDAKQDEIKGYLAVAQNVLKKMSDLTWLCPQKWLAAYGATLSAFGDLVEALADLKVTAEEIQSVVSAFQSAYSAWRTDDEA
jgi:hypothetical protein